MRFRLRYLRHDLELTEGEFAIGRNATCQLSLDDPLVSRRHAVFRVAVDEVFVEDLGSRNGVLVNGQRIDGRVRVRAGDKVLIGSQELTVVQQLDAGLPMSASNATMSLPRVTVPVAPGEASTDEYVASKVHDSTNDLRDDLSAVKRVDGFRLLGSVAEKALAMGRADEAERMLAASLADALDAARRGKAVAPALAEQAARFAAKLATATGRGTWADYAVELYTLLERPFPAVVIDELYGAFRKVTNADVSKVKIYVEALRKQLPSFGPADRFLFQRIEGLERLATLRS